MTLHTKGFLTFDRQEAEKPAFFYSGAYKNKTKIFSDNKTPRFPSEQRPEAGSSFYPNWLFPWMSTDPKSGSWDSCESVPWVRSDHLQHIWIMVYTKMSSYFFLPTIPFPHFLR